MKLGLTCPRFTWPGGDAAIAGKFAAVARGADDAGLNSLWVMDHHWQIPNFGAQEDPMPEAYAALSYAAALTSRVTLGTLVTGATYREPAMLVKQVTTLDALSGGRAVLGIGAGWYEQEARGLGYRFPPLAERFERLEETLQIAKQMWSDEDKPYRGRHHTLERTLNSPEARTADRGVSGRAGALIISCPAPRSRTCCAGWLRRSSARWYGATGISTPPRTRRRRHSSRPPRGGRRTASLTTREAG
ncbi:LLM class flavin-dependent oxidoreductase [Sphaerisporangium sp. NPDC088356]|uniref:LLM class flavin-dependent oxidoreductase n=1 Tax=Sphaerisporangium sp. NPDC088356 TaxID=3154871 RepID=UPI0034125D94